MHDTEDHKKKREQWIKACLDDILKYILEYIIMHIFSNEWINNATYVNNKN